MGVSANKVNLSEKDLDIQKTVKFVDQLEKANAQFNNLLGWLAGASLMLLVFVVVGNAVIRTVYKPFAGTTEIVGWLAAMTTAFALGYTQIQKGYVEIDALMQTFPAFVQRGMKIVMDIISLSFFTMVAWKMFEYASTVAQNGNLSETMGIPYYNLIVLVAVGFIGLCLAILVDLLRQIAGSEGK